MKQAQVGNVVVVAVLLASAVATGQGTAPVLKDQQDKVSYAIGLDIARNLKKSEIDVRTDALVRGLRDGFAGVQPALSDEEIKAVMTAFQQEMRAKQEERVKAQATKNKQEGDAFLAANKAKEGVVALPSGLQYKVLTAGTGKQPKATDTVSVHYRGTLIDGTEFDSSYKRGEPVEFPLTGVIKGWTEGLQLMKEGAKWQFFIPSQLAYGENGAPGGRIGPNSTLIFEVELLAVK